MRGGWCVTAALALAGCGGGDGDGNQAGANAAMPAPAPSPTAPAPRTPVIPNPPVADTSVLAAPVPASQTGSVSEEAIAPGSAQDAGQVVQSYYALVEAGRYPDAYALWDPGTVGATPARFAEGFARYREYHAAVGTPGRINAGAGQRYVTVPVKTYGRLRTGAPFAMTGSVALHRTGDIDGASAAQKRWHIRSIDLKPATPAAAPLPAGVPATLTARYRCIDGSRLTATFDNRADTVTLDRGTRRLGVLAGQRPASGIWYRGGGFELRGKGRDATFTQPNLPPLACRADA